MSSVPRVSSSPAGLLSIRDAGASPARPALESLRELQQPYCTRGDPLDHASGWVVRRVCENMGLPDAPGRAPHAWLPLEAAYQERHAFLCRGIERSIKLGHGSASAPTLIPQCPELFKDTSNILKYLSQDHSPRKLQRVRFSKTMGWTYRNPDADLKESALTPLKELRRRHRAVISRGP
eukprot:gnl/MRDRNA2_/MRDRNA2_115228_c0_seq1.p1 gnl/MRDRNA2_/MRDRNA2_115228_c0~~gnl/MRDRNA2_/MRDRNA2_115228_c0_seq1.p1  ORF type:complete len:179 (-),score=14.03 gnl/MRDRNA2_/MRDRNA2_115228_c0_seq1:7-543(-)